MNFYKIDDARQTSPNRKADIIVGVDFIYGHNRDIICKGGGMYAFWDKGKWNTNEYDLMQLIDDNIRSRVQELKNQYPEANIIGTYMSHNKSKVMKDFKEYAKLSPQSEVQFNTKIIFSNQEIKRGDYATTKLQYTPTPGPTPAFDELSQKLYDQKELDKILWFVGALLTNSMIKIQKFLYLYGGKGTGKGTMLKIFKMLFDGYHEPIDLMKLTSDGDFATSEIKEVPLLIDDDTDLSNIKKDTNLLKLTAHEPLIINSKYKSTYPMRFQGLLIAASNQRYKVRNIDSGITRRAVVAVPTNLTHDYKTYNSLMSRVEFELPMIAQRAIDLFNERGPAYYESYVDYDMIEATDYFFSFVRENALNLGETCTLKQASELYKLYLDELGYESAGYKRKVRQELSRYYKKFYDTKKIDGMSMKNIFEGFKWELVFPDKANVGDIKQHVTEEEFLKEYNIIEQPSIFDVVAKDYPAQLTNEKGDPKHKWDNVMTILKDINTRELHFVRLPLNHIIIDFDLKDGDEKSLMKNIIACLGFPPTYTELSKSGKGVHLHYIYDGDVSQLETQVSDGIEIKVFKGKSALRRKLTKCNDLEIAHISSGLPLREETNNMYKDIEVIQLNEQKMRALVKGNLEKKYHKNTTPSMHFIKKVFDDAQKAGIEYDLTDMRHDVISFAFGSSNQMEECLKIANDIKYSTINQESQERFQKGSTIIPNEELYFYDIEVYPNLFLVAFKKYHDESSKTIWINPTPTQMEWLTSKPLVGFNNRRYDNHIVYSRMLNEDIMRLYRQSQRIIGKQGDSAFYGGAYELSYTDIYDYCSTANKMSLKKWQVKLRIHHDELDFPWDKPVPEKDWPRVGQYCMNDVDSTEAVFDATQGDYKARCILSILSGLSMNATTNQHTIQLVFEGNKNTKDDLVYTDLSKMFPGYKYSYGKSTYRGEEISEGGQVYAEPGVYVNVGLWDIASQHPSSAIAMNAFGKYTKNFKALLDARILIKHGQLEEAGKLFEGRLAQFLTDPETVKDLSNALKTAINSAYGLTSASFDNPFKHPLNVDNIVAKRGALFMVDLKHHLQDLGYKVIHIKTDSIKVANIDDKVGDIIMEFGKKYQYNFEHEATYDKLALINKSTYVCYDSKKGWSSTGTQLIDPYVFKRLFSKEPIEKEDLFVIKEVKDAAIYLDERFIGRFCELYASKTGAEARRVTEDSNSSLNGTKGFKWRLSNEFKDMEDVDFTYYENKVRDTIKDIEAVGDINTLLPEN